MNRKMLLKVFFFHHFFMALCAFVLCWQTFIFLQLPTINTQLCFFVFFATLLSYNTHFYLASQKSTSSDQLKWFQETKKITLLFNTIIFCVTIYFFYLIKNIAIFILLGVAFNAAYTAPLLFKKAIKLPLIFTFVKSYFIGFTWVFATVLLPFLITNQKLGLLELAILFHRFLLVSIATLIFDYRDKLRDLELGVHTPANKMKEHQFQWFFSINLLLMAASIVFLMFTTHQSIHWLQLIVCGFLWWTFKQSKKRTDDLFYLIMVDGALFLSALLSIFLLI